MSTVSVFNSPGHGQIRRSLCKVLFDDVKAWRFWHHKVYIQLGTYIEVYCDELQNTNKGMIRFISGAIDAQQSILNCLKYVGCTLDSFLNSFALTNRM